MEGDLWMRFGVRDDLVDAHHPPQGCAQGPPAVGPWGHPNQPQCTVITTWTAIYDFFFSFLKTQCGQENQLHYLVQPMAAFP